MESDAKKLVIGLYGEMQLSMKLHELGWQVHRAYIDEGIDFTITKYWCSKCKRYSEQLIKHNKYNGKNVKCVTNLCDKCKDTELKVITRHLQVKTSEGIDGKSPEVKKFSFHPKIRYDMGDTVFYVWIAVFPSKIGKICHFYIFNTKDVSLFDDINIDTYQITDNQKTTLTIRNTGEVINNGKKYNYNCFNDKFYMNFNALE